MSRDRAFEDGSWTVDMAEAYFEMKEYEQAQSIVDMVYDGRKKLKTSDLMKIREIKARLLFANGRPKAAYEIMRVLCGRADSTMKQKFILAKMYEKTGRLKDAIEILSLLRFDSPWEYHIYI